MVMDARETFSELTAITKPIYRGKVTNLVLGENKSLRVGSGYEIHNIREWQPEDPLEHIDLDASLPTWPKKVYVLEMFETKNAPLILVADLSASVFVEIEGSVGKFKLLLQSLGALGLGANRLRDPVGVLCFSDNIDFYLPPRLGTDWLYLSTRLLCSKAEKFEAQKRSGAINASATNLNLALQFLISRFPRQQCSVVVFSDFIDTISRQSEINFKLLKTLSSLNNFNVIAIMLDDLKEFGWRDSGGLIRVIDAETNKAELIRANRVSAIRQQFESSREELRSNLRKVGVDSLILSYGGHFDQLAVFLSQRQSLFSPGG